MAGEIERLIKRLRDCSISGDPVLIRRDQAIVLISHIDSISDELEKIQEQYYDLIHWGE